MEAWELLLGIACPGCSEGAGEVVLLGKEVRCAVAHTSRLDEDDTSPFGQHVSEDPFFLREPREPALHAVEDRSVRKALPVLATPGFAADERGGPLPNAIVHDQFACGEDERLFEVGHRSLVVHRKGGETVDLVAPEIDPDRLVRSAREHIDDGPPAGDLASVLDQFLASVPHVDEPTEQFVRVQHGARMHLHRVDVGVTRPEALQEGPDARDHDERCAVRRGEAPEGLGTSPHGLDGWRDALERERLPCGEQHHLMRSEELHEVVVQVRRHRAGGRGDDIGASFRSPCERGEHEGPGGLRYGDDGVVPPGHRRERRLVAEQGEE